MTGILAKLTEGVTACHSFLLWHTFRTIVNEAAFKIRLIKLKLLI